MVKVAGDGSKHILIGVLAPVRTSPQTSRGLLEQNHYGHFE